MRNLTFKILNDTAFISETIGSLTFSLHHTKIRIDEKHMTLTEKAEKYIRENR